MSSWSEGAESVSDYGGPSMSSWAAPWVLSASWSWAAPWVLSASWWASPEREGLLHQPGVVLWRTRVDRPNAARIWRDRPMLMLRQWSATNDDRLRSPQPPPRPRRPRLPLPPTRPFSPGSSFSCASLRADGNRSSTAAAIGPNGRHGRGRCVGPAETSTFRNPAALGLTRRLRTVQPGDQQTAPAGPEPGGGMRSPSSADAMRRKISDSRPRAPLGRSSLRLAWRLAASGPWQVKQCSERMGRMF